MEGDKREREKGKNFLGTFFFVYTFSSLDMWTQHETNEGEILRILKKKIKFLFEMKLNDWIRYFFWLNNLFDGEEETKNKNCAQTCSLVESIKRFSIYTNHDDPNSRSNVRASRGWAAIASRDRFKVSHSLWSNTLLLHAIEHIMFTSCLLPLPSLKKKIL